MPFHLATLARRVRNPRRKSIILRDIVPPAVCATDVYRAVYVPVIALWTLAGDRPVAQYERTLSGMTTDTADDIRHILDDAATEGLFPRVRGSPATIAVRGQEVSECPRGS